MNSPSRFNIDLRLLLVCISEFRCYFKTDSFILVPDDSIVTLPILSINCEIYARSTKF